MTLSSLLSSSTLLAQLVFFLPLAPEAPTTSIEPSASQTSHTSHVTRAQTPLPRHPYRIIFATHLAAAAAMETVTLPHLPNTPIQLCLFKNVQNAAFLRQQLLDGNTDFEYAFLDASVLVSRSHVLAACFRAISDSLNGRLKSRNVHSEIVFSLSPNNNVSQCFPYVIFVTVTHLEPRSPNLSVVSASKTQALIWSL